MTKDVFTIEDGKIIQKERWDGDKEATIIHEINGDDWKMVKLVLIVKSLIDSYQHFCQ